MRHARVLLPGYADPVRIRAGSASSGASGAGFSHPGLPDDAWLPPMTGLVYGALLNDQASVDAYAAKMLLPPHQKPPVAPILYIKPYNTHTGHRSVVTMPAGAARVEVGATLGLVFGATCSRVTEETALAAVAGWTVAIDLSLPKDNLYRPPIQEKCFDGACPIGPWVTGRADVADPGGLAIRTWINGELRHTWSTADLIRPIPKLLVDVSEFMSFYEGDVLLVGYPLTVPTAGAGDALAVEIDQVGRLECRLVADDGGSP